MDALENAAKTHTPHMGGEIIPWVISPTQNLSVTTDHLPSVGPCDVTKKSDLENLVSEIKKKEKYINILVTSAGISGPKAPPDKEDATEQKDNLWNSESFEEWGDVYNTNVSAVYFTTVAFLPLLQAGKESHGHLSASVIVISSISGLISNAQGHFSYNASKGATAHLTTLMAHEFKKNGIRVNSIAPG